MVQNKKVIIMPFFENLVNMVFYTFILEKDYRSQNTPICFKLINYNMRYITFKFLTVPAQNISGNTVRVFLPSRLWRQFLEY